MPKSNGLYVAVAPLALLLIAGLGAHFLPILLDGKADSDDIPKLHRRSPNRNPQPIPVPTPMPKVPAKMQAAMERTISGQLAAFHKNDFGAALTFSSRRFREMVSPDVFRETLSRSYPQLLNATKQDFGPAHGTDTEAVIPVSVITSDGSVTKYLYMLEGEGGSWLIQGCSQLGPPMQTGKPGQQPGAIAATRVRAALQ